MAMAYSAGARRPSDCRDRLCRHDSERRALWSGRMAGGLYVTPSLRSMGIGTALVTAILERARKMDIVAIDLEIDAGHSRAESLYRRFGFRRLDRSRWVRELTT
jgi:GNAT superfamily N-acetyltransferase